MGCTHEDVQVYFFKKKTTPLKMYVQNNVHVWVLVYAACELRNKTRKIGLKLSNRRRRRINKQCVAKEYKALEKYKIIFF